MERTVGKQYSFSTFLNYLSHVALRMTYAELHGVPESVEKKHSLIRKITKKLSLEYKISASTVTPEMIHAERPDLSVVEIRALLLYIQGQTSLDELLEKRSENINTSESMNVLETSIFDMLDYDVEQLFDAFFASLKDVEKYFTLLAVGGCTEEYLIKTLEELSVDGLLMTIVRKDMKYQKHLLVGDVFIERPGRCSALNNASITFHDVTFINTSMIRYQKRKAVIRLKKMQTHLSLEDLAGACGVAYFHKQWNLLVAEYL